MRWISRVGLALQLGLFVVACAPASVTGNYVYRGQWQSAYLNITGGSNKVNGYVQLVSYDATQAEGYRSQVLRFDGTSDGPNFSLKSDGVDRVFGGGLGDCSGRLKGNQILLYVPQADGKTATLVFNRSNATEWNKALAAFRARCYQAVTVQRWRNAYASYCEQRNQQYARSYEKAKQLGAKLETLTGKREGIEKAKADAAERFRLAKSAYDQAEKNAELANRELEEAEAKANDDNSAAAKERVRKARDEHRKADSSLGQAEREKNRAEQIDVDASDKLKNLDEDQEQVKQDLDKAQSNMRELEAEGRLLQDPRFVKAFGEMSKGRFQVATVARNSDVYTTSQPSDGKLTSVGLGASVHTLPVNGDWSLVLLSYGRIGWIKNSDLKVTLVEQLCLSRDASDVSAILSLCYPRAASRS